MTGKTHNYAWRCPDCGKTFDLPGGTACKSRAGLAAVLSEPLDITVNGFPVTEIIQPTGAAV